MDSAERVGIGLKGTMGLEQSLCLINTIVHNGRIWMLASKPDDVQKENEGHPSQQFSTIVNVGHRRAFEIRTTGHAATQQAGMAKQPAHNRPIFWRWPPSTEPDRAWPVAHCCAIRNDRNDRKQFAAPRHREDRRAYRPISALPAVRGVCWEGIAARDAGPA
jgi:hypothetical protein